MSSNDPLGYYALLGVDQSATSDKVKRAFKAKAQQFHPDRNPDPEATREFQLINEAYQVLGNAQARADYDARSYGPPEEDSPPAAPIADPIICSTCQRVTAQPRYVIYRHVVSAVFITWRAVQQGVFCSACGAKHAYRASGKTWLLGWWGFPWGPIYSVQAILSNMLGGKRPPLNNFRILGWQAVYFVQAGRVELGRAVARDALAFADKIPELERLRDPRMVEGIGALKSMLAGTGTNDRVPVLKDLWGVRSRAFKVQLAAAAAFAALVVSIILFVGGSGPTTAYKHMPPTESVALTSTPAGQTLSPDAPVADQSPPAFNEPLVPVPATGRIRALWRSSSETVLAPLRVVTAAGSLNYYVKVVDLKTNTARLVYFVRSGQTADVRIPTGVYELRYAAGENWYGEEWLFGPDTVYRRADEQLDFHTEGDTVAGFTVELIKQVNGNLGETPIKPSDF